jgi:hypothetical protein
MSSFRLRMTPVQYRGRSTTQRSRFAFGCSQYPLVEASRIARSFLGRKRFCVAPTQATYFALGKSIRRSRLPAAGRNTIRAGLEDHFCGELLGLPLGCDVCAVSSEPLRPEAGAGVRAVAAEDADHGCARAASAGGSQPPAIGVCGGAGDCCVSFVPIK